MYLLVYGEDNFETNSDLATLMRRAVDRCGLGYFTIAKLFEGNWCGWREFENGMELK